MPKILWYAAAAAGAYFLYAKFAKPASPPVVDPVGVSVEGDMKRAVTKGKTYTPGGGSISTRWAKASIVKNVSRNTSGKGARINLDQTVTTFGS